ncbi:MAG: hypothetical protein JO026_03830 [Patescibacteria group bacterium]|nr:hypothetical protein [Patescibacteria group bacterium]
MATKVDTLLHRHEAKLRQMENREKAQRRGRAGRLEHKGKARLSNKAKGGKMAK